MAKLAFVTGRGRGIGLAVAQALEAEGYRVVGPKGRTELDLLDPDAVRSHADMILGMYGVPDLVVNNAGMEGSGLLQDMSVSDWNRVMDTNLRGAFLITRAFVPGMVSRKSGCIINIASIWGQVGASFESVYSASKGGLIAFTKALAKELGPSGIRVNCISPGCINTRMMDEYTEEEKAALIEETPLGRIGEPEDVANAVVFLAGDKASFITGQDLGVNGGFVI
jgi:3-oxoacyl-[acyl-carrier protein] reductase